MKKNTHYQKYGKKYQHANKELIEQKRLVKAGNIIPEETELSFYGYKEPLKKFEGGYGFYGVVLYNKDKDKVQCHFCGRLFKNVGIHAKFKHGLNEREYKIKTQLNFTSALVGEGTRLALIEAHHSIPVFGLKTKAEIKKRMSLLNKKAKRKGYNSFTKLEEKNQKGSCPDQLLDKIKLLEKELGHTPTIKEFRKKNTRFCGSIITTFGTWENALKMCGFKSPTQLIREKFSPEKMLEYLKLFFSLHKRTPVTSDTNRGFLPDYRLYIKKFGSLNNARMAAKIPILIRLDRYHSIETMDYAKQPSL